MNTITPYLLLAATLLLAPFAQAAATLTVLHSFSGSLADDSVEEGLGANALALGTDGNLYGTAAAGGAGAVWNAGCGTVFRLAPDGAFTRLHSFSGSDGQGPGGSFGYDVGTGLVQGNDGNFYGRTFAGGIGHIIPNPDRPDVPCGTSPSGYGTLFRMTPDGNLTTFIFFNGANGAGPSSHLLGADGNFYGTTSGGGAYGTTNLDGSYNFGPGTVFRMTPGVGLTTLVSFDGTNGSGPSALLQGKDGIFYGTLSWGGPSWRGGVFKMTPEGVVTTFASFADTNASGPYTLMQASDGNFYGTMFGGGSCSNPYGGPCGYAGTIFKVNPSGELTTLVKFNFSNGAWPLATLVEGTDGNLYGSTSQGGPRTSFPTGGWDHVGTLFRMTPQGKLTTLVFFNGRNGLYPRGNLVQAGDGSFYGTTFTILTNSSYGNGEIFRLTVPGADAPKIISTANSETAVTLNWLTLRGRSYQVQAATDLTLTNWTNIGGPIAATNTLATASGLLGPERQRFYRVALMP
jgi:uncharacterized repeat protein (TIGR03803 family)